MRFRSTILVAALALAACTAPPPAPEPAPAIPDAAVGLNHHAFADDPQPPPAPPPAPDSAEAETVPAAFDGSPPVIPHDTADMFPITRDENVCIDCHDRAEAADVGAPPIPADHYVDLRNAPDVPRDRIAGARWNCHACHVRWSAAKPLVPNTHAR